MKKFIKIASLLVCATGSSAVMALPISGSIEFAVTSNVVGTTINFSDATVAVVDGNFVGDGVGVGDAVDFTGSGFDYNATPFTSVPAMWSTGIFTFDLNTVAVGPSVSLALSGTGILSQGDTISHSGSDYDAVTYNWTYSSDTSRLRVFSSPLPAAVPEPGAFALLGLGLVGFAVAGYGRRRTQA